MPVVMDYAPVNAILSAASNVGANRNAMESQQLTDDQQRLQLAQQQAGMQQQAQAFAQQQAQQAAATRAAAFAAAEAANAQRQQPEAQQLVGYTSPDGSTLRVSPQQRAMLQNIDAQQGLSDEQKAYARQRVLGVAPSVTQTVNGQDVQMDPMQASLVGHRSAQEDLAQNKFDLSKLTADQRKAYQDAHIQILRDDNDRKLQALGDSELQHQIATSRAATDDAVKAAQQTLTTAQRNYAQVLEQVKEAAIENKGFNAFAPAQDGEPVALTSLRAKLLRAQGAVDAAAAVRDQRVQEQAQEHQRESQLLAAAPGSKRGGAAQDKGQEPNVGQPFAGSTVARAGTAASGERVFQLQDGRVVDASGRPIQ